MGPVVGGVDISLASSGLDNARACTHGGVNPTVKAGGGPFPAAVLVVAKPSFATCDSTFCSFMARGRPPLAPPFAETFAALRLLLQGDWVLTKANVASAGRVGSYT